MARELTPGIEAALGRLDAARKRDGARTVYATLCDGGLANVHVFWEGEPHGVGDCYVPDGKGGWRPEELPMTEARDG